MEKGEAETPAAAAENNVMKGVKHLCENGVAKVPTKYILPLPDRPRLAPAAPKPNLKLPVVDVARLLSPADRSRVLQTLDSACREYGFFQVVNHGIEEEVIRRMIEAGKGFFELPFEERARYMSSDVGGAVRYGTSFNQTKDRVYCWRDFLKLSCHPLESVLLQWPSSPVDFKEEAVSYAKRIRSLFLVVMEGVLEALGVRASGGGGGGVMEEFEEEGSQLLVLNCYPACPEPQLTLGMPPHSDYGFLTFVLQDEVEGLQVLHGGGEWITVEPVPNSFVVNVGDHLEIFSNGRYRSVLHRVLVNEFKSRMSVASLHSLSFDSVVRPSPELVDEETRPRLYKDTDFAAFLDYLSSCEPKRKSFLESRKLTPPHRSLPAPAPACSS